MTFVQFLVVEYFPSILFYTCTKFWFLFPSLMQVEGFWNTCSTSNYNCFLTTMYSTLPTALFSCWYNHQKFSLLILAIASILREDEIGMNNLCAFCKQLLINKAHPSSKTHVIISRGLVSQTLTSAYIECIITANHHAVSWSYVTMAIIPFAGKEFH